MRNTSQDLVNEFHKNEGELNSNMEELQEQLFIFQEQEKKWKLRAKELTLLVQAIAKENEELKHDQELTSDK